MKIVTITSISFAATEPAFADSGQPKILVQSHY